MIGREARGEITGNGGAHQVDVERLQVVEDIGKLLDDLVFVQDVLVVDGAEYARNKSCSFEIIAFVEANGERVKLGDVPSRDGGDDGAVETSRKKSPHRNIAHQTFVNSVFDRSSHRQRHRARVGRGVQRRRGIRQSEVLVKAGPRMKPGARRKLARLSDTFRKSLELGSEQKPSVILGHVERLDAHRIARRVDVLAVGNHESEHSIEVVRKLDSVHVVKMESRLGVASGVETVAPPQTAANFRGVVDFTVADDGSSLVRSDRLITARGIHDGEATMPERAVLALELAGGIRAPVRETREHAINELGLGSSPDGGDAAH